MGVRVRGTCTQPAQSSYHGELDTLLETTSGERDLETGEPGLTASCTIYSLSTGWVLNTSCYIAFSIGVQKVTMLNTCHRSLLSLITLLSDTHVHMHANLFSL